MALSSQFLFTPFYYQAASPDISKLTPIGRKYPPHIIDIDSLDQLNRHLSGLKKKRIAVILFSTQWCRPCQDYYPYFEKTAKNSKGQYLFLRIKKTDEIPNLERKYNIVRFPTLKIFGRHLSPQGVEVPDSYYPIIPRVLPQFLGSADQLSHLRRVTFEKIIRNNNCKLAQRIDALYDLQREGADKTDIQLSRIFDEVTEPYIKLQAARAMHAIAPKMLENPTDPAAISRGAALRKIFFAADRKLKVAFFEKLRRIKTADIAMLAVLGVYDPRSDISNAAMNVLLKNGYFLNLLSLTAMAIAGTDQNVAKRSWYALGAHLVTGLQSFSKSTLLQRVQAAFHNTSLTTPQN